MLRPGLRPLLAGVLVVSAAAAAPAWSADPTRSTVRTAARVTTAAGNVCGPLLEVRRPSGKLSCTHGHDPRDGHWPRRGSGPGPGAPADGKPAVPAPAAAGLACEGDGEDGNRVQAIYAVPAGRRDQYPLLVETIRAWAEELDVVFRASAARTGGTRRVRFVTQGAACQLSVLRVPVPAEADDTFWGTVAALEEQGFDRPDRKYLVWMDSDELCGQAEMWIDDRPGAQNKSNGPAHIPGGVARVDRPCWGLGEQGRSVEAHELMHLLGGVQPSAPNGTSGAHCDDDADRMCYADGSVGSTRPVCSGEGEALFDCDADDYFHTDPPPGSYLASHWNTAASSFLTSRNP